jgi:hypothetical protein
MPDPPAGLLDEVRRLDGVREVTKSGALVTVRGHRRIVAYAGAVLVRWDAVPADLSVWQPSLEDALIGLLSVDQNSVDQNSPDQAGGAPAADDELVGGQR